MGHIDKVINSAYYDTVPKERTSGFENTLDYLQKQYDKNELSIKYHYMIWMKKIRRFSGN